MVKKAIGKIVGAIKREKEEYGANSVFYLIDHPEEMDRFLRYIDEYYTCFDQVSEETRNAVLEEMVVDRMSPAMEQLLEKADPHMDVGEIRDISPFSEEEILKIVLEVRRDFVRRHDLRREAFAGFWEKIDEWDREEGEPDQDSQ